MARRPVVSDDDDEKKGGLKTWIAKRLNVENEEDVSWLDIAIVLFVGALGATGRADVALKRAAVAVFFLLVVVGIICFASGSEFRYSFLCWQAHINCNPPK